MKQTKQIRVRDVLIGGGAPIAIQSMTNTDTRDAKATLAQIRALADAGCDIVRCAVPDAQAAEALREICAGSPIPVVADIHFDYRLALASIEAGVDKIRLNLGNIGGADRVHAVVQAAKARHIPIRIGVNSGSVEKHILEKFGGPTPGRWSSPRCITSACSMTVGLTISAFRSSRPPCRTPCRLTCWQAKRPITRSTSV